MAMHRLIPPASGPTIVANGRSYNPAAGAQDVPDFDAVILEANGWSVIGHASGTTASRPTTSSAGTRLVTGFKFFDSTIGKTVTWDGKAWRKEDGTVG